MSTTERTETQATVVIIGGGASGLAAAVSAAEAGVKDIIVLEKTKKAGGAGLFPQGFFAVNSPAQQRLGISVSKDQVYRDQLEYTIGRCNAKVLRVFLNRSADIVRWIEGKGMKFNAVMTLGSGDPEIFHKLNWGPEGRVGAPLMAKLIEDCQKLGVQILCETAARKILTDGEGRVTGVLAVTEDKELEITTKSVIIATGDFSANKEMLEKYLPSLVLHGEVQGESTPHMTGDGILMAEEIGAAIDDQFTTTLVGPTYIPRKGGIKVLWSGLRLLSRRPEAIRVNKNGERYYNEAAQHILGANALRKQPDKACYTLLDSKIIRDMIGKREILSGMEKDSGENWLDKLEGELQEAVAEQNVGMADSWDEIAEWIEVAPETLRTTIEQYNSFCDNGYDADFLKGEKYLFPLRTPPYYAIPCGLHFESTFGGIRINERMEAVDWRYKPILGLYATGNNTSGLFGYDYPAKYPGFAFGFALCSGYIAGESVAKYVMS